MSLLATSFVKSSRFFYLSKKAFQTRLELSSMRNLYLSYKFRKTLAKETIFSISLQVSFSHVTLNPRQKPQSYKNCQTNQIQRDLGKVVWQLVKQYIYTSFLLIIKPCLNCGKQTICSIIRKSQNIIAMIVCKNFFC